MRFSVSAYGRLSVRLSWPQVPVGPIRLGSRCQNTNSVTAAPKQYTGLPSPAEDQPALPGSRHESIFHRYTQFSAHTLALALALARDESSLAAACPLHIVTSTSCPNMLEPTRSFASTQSPPTRAWLLNTNNVQNHRQVSWNLPAALAPAANPPSRMDILGSVRCRHVRATHAALHHQSRRLGATITQRQ